MKFMKLENPGVGYMHVFSTCCGNIYGIFHDVTRRHLADGFKKARMYDDS